MSDEKCDCHAAKRLPRLLRASTKPATLSTTRSDSLLGHGSSSAVALTDGYHLAFTIAAALVVAAIAIGLAFLRPTGTLHAVGEPGELTLTESEALLEEAA